MVISTPSNATDTAIVLFVAFTLMAAVVTVVAIQMGWIYYPSDEEIERFDAACEQEYGTSWEFNMAHKVNDSHVRVSCVNSQFPSVFGWVVVRNDDV